MAAILLAGAGEAEYSRHEAIEDAVVLWRGVEEKLAREIRKGNYGGGSREGGKWQATMTRNSGEMPVPPTRAGVDIGCRKTMTRGGVRSGYFPMEGG